ncbi:MAG TPA: hypothetical protein PK777_17025 [Thermoguttaceae bacterium]|nr:hypothetical protein [Thermoguttaceae bacterium]
MRGPDGRFHRLFGAPTFFRLGFLVFGEPMLPLLRLNALNGHQLTRRILLRFDGLLVRDRQGDPIAVLLWRIAVLGSIGVAASHCWPDGFPANFNGR